MFSYTFVQELQHHSFVRNEVVGVFEFLDFIAGVAFEPLLIALTHVIVRLPETECGEGQIPLALGVVLDEIAELPDLLQRLQLFVLLLLLFLLGSPL